MNRILEAIHGHAAAKPQQLALSWINEKGQTKLSLTYQEVIEKINGISGYFALQGGLTQGDVVVLLFPPGLDFILAFLACMQLGLIAVPLKIANSDVRLASILAILYDCQPKCIISPNIIPDSKNFPFRWLLYRESTASLLSMKAITLPEIAFLQYTSGTTGDPKGVMVSHDNLLHNFALMQNHLDIQAQDVITSWLPHYHDMGLIGNYLAALYFGLSGYYMAPTTFMLNPNIFLQIIDEKRVASIQCPNTALDWMVEKWDKRQIDLSSLRNVYTGAEPVHVETLEKFYQLFKSVGLRKEALKPSYGLAEATLFVAQANQPCCLAKDKKVPYGYFAEIDTRIVDPQTYMECEEGKEGEIWLSSPSNALGYYHKEILSKEIFAAKIKNQVNPYLRTGDLGYIWQQQLYITGRLKDLIIINGQNIYPQDIERTAEQFPGVFSGRTAAFSWHHGNETKIVVMAEVNKYRPPDLNSLIAHLLKNHSIPIFDVVLCPQGSLLKTSSGKVKRLACKQAYQLHNIPILSQMDKSWGVIEFITNTYKDHPQETFYQLGIDSLTMVNLLYELQKKIPGKIKSDLSIPQLYQMTVGEFILICNETKAIDNQVSANKWFQRMQQLSEARLVQIKQDANLDLSQLAKPHSITPNAMIEQVFLTGSTGFLGAYLLLFLLKMTNYYLHLLVRADTIECAYQKLKNNLIKYQLLEAAEKCHLSQRITLYCGDLGRPNFGLSFDQWNHLTQVVDAIYHNGATTNYVANYEDLKPANVEGTRTIIELAYHTRIKYLHYISTTFIFGWTASKYVQENSHNDIFKHVDFGYSQSKWVAEQLVWQCEKYEIPIQIYRPAWITASNKGKYTSEDIIVRTLTYMINHQVTLNIPNQLSLLPVNKVAQDIIALSLQEKPAFKAYHLTAEYVNIPIIFKYITEKYGYKFTYLSLGKFNQHFKKHAMPKDNVYPLVPFFNAHYKKIAKMSNKIYKRDNYLFALKQMPNYQAKEYTYQETADYIIEFLQNNKLIPKISKHHLLVFLKSHRMRERRSIKYYYLKFVFSMQKIFYILRMMSIM